MNLPPEAADEESRPREPASYLNGQFVPFSQAKLPLFDAGLVYGATVTEFIRTFRLQLYRLQDHLKRFYTSCRLAEIPIANSIDELTQIAQELIARNAPLSNPGVE